MLLLMALLNNTIRIYISPPTLSSVPGTSGTSVHSGNSCQRIMLTLVRIVSYLLCAEQIVLKVCWRRILTVRISSLPFWHHSLCFYHQIMIHIGVALGYLQLQLKVYIYHKSYLVTDNNGEGWGVL